MRKHPDCEDRCQILEHKGYHDCTHTGRCELLESLCAGTKEGETPETDAKWHEVSIDLPFTLAANNPLEGLGEIVPADFARSLERRLRAALSEREGKPVAWIEHHKGGDNLNWEQANNNDTPLYRLSAHDERR